MEMPRAKKAMTTEYVQLSGYIPVRRAVKAARHDPVCEKHRNSSKAGERPGLPQMKGCSLQAMKAHPVTMVLPAVGRHETRTGEMPMELITVSHPDSSLLGGRGSNKAKTYFAVDTAKQMQVSKPASVLRREVHPYGSGEAPYFFAKSIFPLDIKC